MMRYRGFSLLEVLVSLAVLLGGTLGLLGLQSLLINNTQAAAYRSLAASQASSIAAAIKANPGFWGTPPSTVRVQNTNVTGMPNVSAPSESCSFDNRSNSPAPCCVYSPSNTAACSNAQLAYSDLVTAGVAMAQLLPVGQFGITCELSVTPAICTIQVSWMEKNIATHTPAAAASALASGSTQTSTYTTQVSPL